MQEEINLFNFGFKREDLINYTPVYVCLVIKNERQCFRLI